MRKCPICGKEIEDYLRKCSNCDSYISKIRRFFDGLRFYFEPLTFMAAIIVLGVMIWSNLQVKDSIKLTKKIVEQGDQNLKLFKASVDKIDTGFALQRTQIDLQEKGVKVEESKKEVALKESIEKNRPRIEIATSKADTFDSGFIVYTDIENNGASDAENVLVSIICVYSMSQKDTLKQNWIFPKITKNRIQNVPYSIPTPYRGDFYSLVDVRYSWPLYNKEYRDYKYFSYVFDKNKKVFSTYVLDETQARKIWK